MEMDLEEADEIKIDDTLLSIRVMNDICSDILLCHEDGSSLEIDITQLVNIVIMISTTYQAMADYDLNRSMLDEFDKEESRYLKKEMKKSLKEMTQERAEYDISADVKTNIIKLNGYGDRGCVAFLMEEAMFVAQELLNIENWKMKSFRSFMGIATD